MFKRKINLTPNQVRVVYDSTVAVIAASLVYTYLNIFLGLPVSKILFLSPLPLFLFNLAFGIFSRLRVGSGLIKAPALALSISLSAALLALLGTGAHAAILWSVLVFAPIILPRVFLNLNTRLKTDFISSTIKQRGPVLVVGGGGYIGTHVVEQLLKNGFPVRILDRFIYSKKPIQEFLSDPRFEYIEGDITDIMKLSTAMSGVSAVVHLGGLVGDPACSVDPAFTRHANVISTRMLKEVAISLGIPRFVFASSCSVYGSNEKEVDETSDLNPVSLYAQTKIDSEKELLSCVDESFCLTILRFATVFGYSRRPRFDLVANLFTAQAMNEGRITVIGSNQWRPFVHVRDLALAIVKVLKAPSDKVSGQIFNVGDSRLNLTIGQLAERVQKVVSKERAVELATKENIEDRRNYFVSFNKIKKVLGFEAVMTIESGVEELVDAFKRGEFTNYREAHYSNLEMTKIALRDFRDPLQSSRLYHPLAEETNTVEQPKAANS